MEKVRLAYNHTVGRFTEKVAWLKALIGCSSSEISAGSRLLDEAAECIAGMLEGVSSNSKLMDSIANGSRKQSGAIAEMAAAVRQMDEMTQHIAALVEDTNAAIKQTEGETGELDRIVEIFMVADAAPLHQATRTARQAG